MGSVRASPIDSQLFGHQWYGIARERIEFIRPDDIGQDGRRGHRYPLLSW
jgi:hypothetical protein